ncbi:hypothetical protein GF339_18480 [candidate division KSB3 bacterium]|jgi:hypothetical protein|uniref:DUF1737 domain-containing protein n=1 Tax=candidate division KSB3 bacterium TaxID=2044937 RepID=A0A9D5Q7R4_9BACT|nr:hypothetical protein [candidate division KSB3 bacterium]MBD3326577.1 hypothetical protein [candidate division KSB3 bacterium]
MKYKVVKVLNNIEKFETEIMGLLDDGWQLYGDLQVVAAPFRNAENMIKTNYLYAQVLTKDK